MSKLTDTQRIEIVQKFKNGYSKKKLAQEYNVSTPAIISLLRTRGFKPNSSQRKYTLNENYFDKIDTWEKAYLLGWMFSDGYNSEKYGRIEFVINKKDERIALFFREQIGSNRPISYKTYNLESGNKSTNCQMLVSSRHMSESLAAKGCIQNKSLTLLFPTEESLPADLLKPFILGYYEGDGSFYSKGSRRKIEILSTRLFCEELNRRLKKELGFELRLKPANNNGISTRAFANDKFRIFTLLDWLYSGSRFHLERKFSKYLEHRATYEAA